MDVCIRVDIVSHFKELRDFIAAIGVVHGSPR